MPSIDFPNVRGSALCPLCEKSKDAGLLVCWSCYRASDIRNGNTEAELLIARAESELRAGSNSSFTTVQKSN